MERRSTCRDRSSMGRCASVVALVTVLLGGWGVSRSNASPGDLDPSFSRDGRLRMSEELSADNVAVQQDGKTLAAGSVGGRFLLMRFDQSGELDASFGQAGIVQTSFEQGAARIGAIVVQPDGRIVAGGGAGADFAIARYGLDGTLDPTFSGDGKATLSFGGESTARIADIALQADGTVAAVGTYNPDSDLGGYHNDLALARYQTDGALDTTFSGDGVLTQDIGGGRDDMRAVAIDSNGRIAVAGTVENFSTGTSRDIALVRFDANGSVDSTFSGSGTVITDVAGEPQYGLDLAVDADDKLVVAGFGYLEPFPTGSSEVLLLRYGTDGALDPTFSVDGVAATGFGVGSFDAGEAIAIQPNGALVVAGAAGEDFAVDRYKSVGELDPAFSGDGHVTTPFSRQPFNRVALAWDVALGSDGTITAIGTFVNHSNDTNETVLARYLANPGPPDADADGVLDPDDACPDRFGESKSGCHRFRRSLSVRYEPKVGKLVVTLSSVAAACISRPVALFRVVPGPDRRIAKGALDALSNFASRWRVPVDRGSGQYYVRIQRIVKPDVGICPPARTFWPHG